MLEEKQAQAEKAAETAEEAAKTEAAQEKQHQAGDKTCTGKKAPATQNNKKQTVAKPVTNRTVRVDIEKLDALMNQVSELIIAKNSLVSIAPLSPVISRTRPIMSRSSIWSASQQICMSQL